MPSTSRAPRAGLRNVPGGSSLKKLLLQALAGLVASGMASAAMAAEEKYPSKPIQVLVGYPAGGIVDVMARKLTEEIRKKEGWDFVIVNRPGAGATLGPARVAASPPDGYTVGLAATTVFTVAPFYMDSYPKELTERINHLVTVGQSRTGVFVKADSPYRSFEDLMAAARKPGSRISIGTPGLGSQTHLFMEAHSKRERIPLTVTPFNGTPPGVTALLGNHIDALIGPIGPISGSLETRTVRMIAAVEKARLRVVPEVPTLAEQGIPLVSTSIIEVFGPAGLPEAVEKRLVEAFSAASRTPVFVELNNSLGADNDNPMSGKALQEFVARDLAVNEALFRGRPLPR